MDGNLTPQRLTPGDDRPPAGCRLAGKSGDVQQPKRIDMENQQNGCTNTYRLVGGPAHAKDRRHHQGQKEGKLGQGVS